MTAATDALSEQAVATGNAIGVPAASGLRFGDFVRRTLAGAQRDRLSVFAGNLAFRTLFACFPCLFTLFWLLEAFGGTRAVQSAVGLFTTALPTSAGGAVQQQFAGTTADQARGALTIGALVAVTVAVWAVIGAFRSLMDALNTVDGLEESRPVWQRYLVAMALASAVTVLLAGAVILAVFGAAITRHLGQLAGSGPVLHWAWTIASWPVLAVAVLLAFSLVYTCAPARRAPFRWLTTGSALATLLWLLFTVAFSVYINRFAAPTRTYGALAGIAVLMLYLYGSAFILLLGAEMNRVIETHAAGTARPRENHLG
jgi:membrane protein